MTPPPHESPPRRMNFAFWRWSSRYYAVTIMTSTPAVYFLSAKPIIYLYLALGLSNPTRDHLLDTFYYPVGYAAFKVPMIAEFQNWQMQVLVGLFGNVS